MQLAKPLKPNVMLLVDTSSSMKLVVDGTTSTRLQEVQAAMSGFISQNLEAARFALTRFPDAPGGDPFLQCRPPSATHVDLAAPALEDDEVSMRAISTVVSSQILALDATAIRLGFKSIFGDKGIPNG